MKKFISKFCIILLLATPSLWGQNNPPEINLQPTVRIPPISTTAIIDGTGGFDLLEGINHIEIFEMDDTSYALVTSVTDDSFTIIDVSNPSSPTLVSAFTDGTGGFERLNGAFYSSIFTSGESTYAVIASALDNAIQIVDISDPTAPTPVSSAVDGQNGFSELSSASSSSVIEINQQTYAVVTGRFDRGIEIINITDPSNPTSTSTITEGFNDPSSGIFLSDFRGPFNVTTTQIGSEFYAFVAIDDDDGILIANISDPSSPTIASLIYDGEDGFEGLGSTADIEIVTDNGSTYALVASRNGVFQIFDVSSPTNPQSIAIARDGEDGFDYLAGAISVTSVEIGENRYALVSAQIDDAVQIIDITDIENPRAVTAAVDEENGINYLNGQQSLTTLQVGGNTYALVASLSENALQIIEISERSSSFTVTIGESQIIATFSDGDGGFVPEGQLNLPSINFGSLSYDETTGVLTYLANSTGGEDSFTVTVNDGENPEVSQSFSISVVSPDSPPEFTSIDEGDIAEGASNVIAIISDGDGGFAPSSQVSFTADQSNGTLSYDDTNGELTYTADDNFLPSGTDTFDVTVDDGENPAISRSFSITVTNVNDAPVISSTGPFSIDENTTGVVGTISATDTDGDTLSYSVDDTTNFSIDSDGNLSLEVAQDFEATSSLTVNVTVSDSNGGSDSQAITINITQQAGSAGVTIAGISGTGLASWHNADVADSFLNASGGVASNGESVAQWLDQSGNDNHLTQSTSSNQATLSSGVLLYDNTGEDYYDYAQRISATTQSGLSTFSVIQINDLSGYNFLFGDSTEFGFHGDTGANIFNDRFDSIDEVSVNGSIDSVSGAQYVEGDTQIIFTQTQRTTDAQISNLSNDRNRSDLANRGIRGEVSEVIIFERELNRSEELVVTNYLNAKWGVTLGSGDFYDQESGGNGTFSSEVSGVLQVSSSDNHLVSESFGGISLANSSAGGIINEDGDALFIGHNDGDGLSRQWYVDVTDASGDGGTVDFTFDANELGLTDGTEYTLTLDSINENATVANGELVFSGISAVDGIASLSLFVANNSPEFTAVDEGDIAEGASNVIAIISDGDGGFAPSDQVSFTADQSNGTLSYDDTNGELTYTADDNFLPSGTDSFDVTVDDGENPAVSRSFSITVTNVNDAPVISTTGSFNIDENTTGVVGTISATDADGDTLSYSVDDTTNFSIDSDGNLNLEVAQDFETTSSLTVNVTVSDSNGGSTEQEITVNITDVDEVGSLSSISGNFTEGNLISTTLTDPEGIDGVDVTFELLNSNGDVIDTQVIAGGGATTDVSFYLNPNQNLVGENVTIRASYSNDGSQVSVEESGGPIQMGDDGVTIAGISGVGLASWHDVSVVSSLRNNGNQAAEGEQITEWQDQSGNDNTLSQNNSFFRPRLTNGVLSFDSSGNDFLNYSNGISATSSSGLSTFSVLEITDITGENFLFGNNNTPVFHGDETSSRIFNNDSNIRIAEVSVDGSEQTQTTASYEEDQTQIIFTQTDRDDIVEISRLSQDRGFDNRSLQGNVSEIIIFERELNRSEELVVTNYLNAKWGVSLNSGDFYDQNSGGNGTFEQEVSGILQVSSTDNHLSSESFGGISLRNSSSGGIINEDGDALFVGHNGVDGVSRQWYFDTTDVSSDGGTIDIVFDGGELGLVDGEEYTLTYGSVSESAIVVSGELSFTNILAVDGVASLSQMVDNPPEFTSIDEGDIAEGASNVIAIISDGDGGFAPSSQVTFTADQSNGTLSYDETNGELTYSADDNFLPSGTDTFDVTVDDGENPAVTRSFSITVTNVNNAPILEAAGPFSIAENDTGSLGTVSASDVDGDTLSYSVDDTTNFSITSSGELSLILEQDFETNSSLSVDVTVSDGNGGSDTQTILVNITDVDEVGSLSSISGNFTEGNLVSTTLTDSEGVDGVDVIFELLNSNGDVIDTQVVTGSGTTADVSFFLNPNQNLVGENITIRANYLNDGSQALVEESRGPVRAGNDGVIIAGISGIGLGAWHNADVADSFLNADGDVASDGESVSQWLDQSGNNNHLSQTDSSLQGVSSNGVLQFDGTGSQTYNYASEISGSETGGLSTFSVVQILDTSSAIFLFGDDNSALYHGISGDRIFSNTLSDLAEVSVDGSSIDGVVDGDNLAFDNALFDTTRTQVIFTQSERNNQAQISRLSQDRGGNSRSIRGDVSEVIIFERELSRSEELVVTNYLSAKWGLVLGSGDFYDESSGGNGTFDREVSGIIQISSEDNHLSSESFGGISLRNSSSGGIINEDGDAVLVGHNGSDGLARQWYLDVSDQSGDGGSIDLTFDAEELGLEDGTTYTLSYGATSEGAIVSSGELTFTNISAVDGIASLSETNNSPVFTQVDEDDILEGSSNDITVLTDGNGGNVPANQIIFEANQTDGTLSYNEANGVLTYTANASFAPSGIANEFTITIDDGENAPVARQFSITVINVNDAPTISTTGPFNIAENTTGTLGTISASDVDGDILSYNVDDTENFSIDSEGVLSLITAQDFEENSSLIVNITVSDGNGGIDTQEITANITDEVASSPVNSITEILDIDLKQLI